MLINMIIRDSDGDVIVAATGGATDASPIGGTFANPDFEAWHEASSQVCEKVRMYLYSVGACDSTPKRYDTRESEFGLYICGFKLQDCNGTDCIILDCA